MAAVTIFSDFGAPKNSLSLNKASEGDGIPAELFQILWWCCESAALYMPASLENSALATGLEMVSFHSHP